MPKFTQVGNRRKSISGMKLSKIRVLKGNKNKRKSRTKKIKEPVLDVILSIIFLDNQRGRISK